MALSTGGDRDVMASLAARLTGRSSIAPSLTPKAPAAPRSLPAGQFPHNAGLQPFATAKENVRPVASYASTKQQSPIVDPFEDDVTMTDVDAGPSLRGTANQLALAREFAETATQGGRRSNPSHSSRHRIASREGSRTSFSSSSSSPRRAVASLGIRPGSEAATGTQRPLPGLSTKGGAKPDASHMVPPHRRLQEKLTSAAPPTTRLQPSIGTLSTMNVTVPAGQLKDATKTAKEHVVEATTPPHLRGKIAEATVAGNKNEVAQVLKVHVATGPSEKKLDSFQEAPQHTTANGTSHPKLQTGETKNQDVVEALGKVREELSAINNRVGNLEKDSFDMQRQLQTLIQAEERRKFLGTRNTKVPFAQEVKCPNGKVYNIQVHAELKVYDLVRRIRVAADLAPAASINPRVAVNGTEVGHVMMLGEVGIDADKQADVVFSYGG